MSDDVLRTEVASLLGACGGGPFELPVEISNPRRAASRVRSGDADRAAVMELRPSTSG